jgi:putative ABC transport system substrate-binding protein
LGLVASLNRPGGNVTGIANFDAELAPKQLQLLQEVFPNASRFGVLADAVSASTQSASCERRRARWAGNSLL